MGDLTATVDGQEPNDTTNQAAAQPNDEQTNAQSTESKEQDSEPKLSAEELAAELSKARAEAARRRVERNEARAKLAELTKEPKPDAERLAALEKELADSRMQAARVMVAKETGLPEELIHGDDAETMTENAQVVRGLVDKLVEEAVAEKLKATPPMPVVSGEAAGGKPKSDEDWLRKAFLEK